jgi:hypothetical protein
MTTKSDYCFCDFQSLKSGERTKKSKAVYGALIRCFAVLSMAKQNSSLSWRVLSFVGENFFRAQVLKEA